MSTTAEQLASVQAAIAAAELKIAENGALEVTQAAGSRVRYVDPYLEQLYAREETLIARLRTEGRAIRPISIGLGAGA
jgi:enoyl reductase-like protein